MPRKGVINLEVFETLFSVIVDYLDRVTRRVFLDL